MFRESYGDIYIDEEVSLSLALFQRCEPEYQSAAPGVRIWTDAVQCVILNNNQQGDPFYSAERFARYHSRVAAYRRAMQADSYTTPETIRPMEPGKLTTLLPRGQML